MKKKTLRFHADKCDFCGSCVAVCQPDAILLFESSMHIEQDRCTACGRCTVICPFGALEFDKP